MYISLVFLQRYLQGGLSDVLTSLDGPELDSDLKNYEEILRSNRRNLLHTHFIDGKKRADTRLQVLYVTTEDRALAEDIRNATKDEIFRRIAEKLLLLTDEETREPLSSRFGVLKSQPRKQIRKLLSCCTMRLWKSCKTKRHRKRCESLTCLRKTEKLTAA